MREKTRCEVDEPISTPTESTQSSASSPNVRPVLEKKTRPPWSPSLMRNTSLKAPPSFLRQQATIVTLVIFRPHAIFGAFALHALGIFLPQERILHVIGNRAAAFGNIHRRVIGVLFAWRAGLAAGIVRPEPGRQ